MSTSSPSIQQLDVLKKRIEAQKTARAEAQAEAKVAREQLAKAQKAAVAEFGTADPAELRILYKKNEEDNARKLADCVSQLDAAEAELNKLKSGTNSTESDA